MDTPHFRPLLKRAARITFSSRYLILFGLVVALVGSGGELDMALKGYDKLLDILVTLATDGFAGLAVVASFLWAGAISIITENPLATIAVLVAYVIFTLGILWVLFVARGVLIAMPGLEDVKRRCTVKEIAALAHRKYRSFLAIAVLQALVQWVPFIAVAGAVAFFAPSSLDITAPALLFFLFVPVSFITAYIAKFAFAALMIDNQSLIESVKTAISLFRKNWLASIEFGIILLLLGIVLFAISSYAAFVLLTPFLLLASVFARTLSLTAASITQGAGFVLFFLVLLSVGVFFTIFEYASWSLFYCASQRGEIKSKIMRLFRRV